MRLIDADALIDKLKKQVAADKKEFGTRYMGTLMPVERVIKLIESAK